MTDAVRLEPGDIAPDFQIADATGTEVPLSRFRGRKVILFFYPAAMTPGCTKEACGFRDSLADFREAGYDIVGISPDTPAKLARFAAKEDLPYPLLSDMDKRVLEAYGAWGEKTMYGKKVTGVIRSTVVVDEKGVIEQAYYNVKATGHVERLRKELLGAA